MKPLNRLFSTLLASFCALSAAGCHGSRGLPAFSVPEHFDDAREYELTFWAKNDTNKIQTAVYTDAIKAFEKLYPNIHVNIRLYTDYGRIYNDVITNISTATTPNVCITYPDHIATYITGQNVVAPLDELFADPEYGFGGSELRYDGPDAGEMIGKFLDECAIGGVHYAIPFIYKSTDNMMIQQLAQRGAGYSTSKGDVLLFGGDTEEILRDVADHTAAGAFSTFKISSYPGNFLNAGQCLFAVDSTAGATWMGSHAPNSDISPDKFVEFEIATRPVPQIDPSNPKMISQGPSVCVFNKADPEEVLASWLFAQFLLTNDVQLGYAETEGYIPVTAKAQSDPAYLDYLSRSGEDDGAHYAVKIEATQLLLDNIENTFVTPVFNGSASLRDAAGQLIENTAKSVRRKETVDGAYFEKLYDDVRSLYRLDQLGERTAPGGEDLGPLPGTSVALLCGIGSVWILMGAYLLTGAIRKKLEENRRKT
jgi:multiple sugar transport system substrate-binding protein